MHHEFVPESATVNRERYKEVLVYLLEPIWLKHRKMWAANNWVLLYENTPTCQSVLAQQ